MSEDTEFVLFYCGADGSLIELDRHKGMYKINTVAQQLAAKLRRDVHFGFVESWRNRSVITRWDSPEPAQAR